MIPLLMVAAQFADGMTYAAGVAFIHPTELSMLHSFGPGVTLLVKALAMAGFVAGYRVFDPKWPIWRVAVALVIIVGFAGAAANAAVIIGVLSGGIV